MIRQNAEKFGCHNIEVIEGVAPEAMNGLPQCHVILIGGTGGNLSSILDAADDRLAPGGRIVLTAVTAETTGISSVPLQTGTTRWRDSRCR